MLNWPTSPKSLEPSTIWPLRLIWKFPSESRKIVPPRVASPKKLMFAFALNDQ